MDYGMKGKGPRTGGVKPSREMAAAGMSRSGRGAMRSRRGMDKGNELWPATSSMMGSSRMMVGEPTTSSKETMKYKG